MNATSVLIVKSAEDKFTMKLFTLALTCLVLFTAHAYTADAQVMVTSTKPIMENCSREVGMDPAELDVVLDPTKRPLPEELANTTYCLVACILNNSGLLHEGKLDAKAIKNNVTNSAKVSTSLLDELTSQTDNCIDQAHQETGECNVVGKFFECFAAVIAKINKVQRNRILL